MKPFAQAWSELKENLLNTDEYKEFLKLSILNIDEIEALQISNEFYKNWKLFNKVEEEREVFKISHFKEETKENNHSLFEYKKGA